METQSIVVLDFGAQYSQLIARRIREQKIFSVVLPFNASLEEIRSYSPVGIILSGGPSSVYDQDAPLADKSVFDLGIPVLGICYGLQFMVYALGGKVRPAAKREYGHAEVEIQEASSQLFHGLPKLLTVWMSHGDSAEELPPGFRLTAKTANAVAAIENAERKMWAVQFHPEVHHTPLGSDILRNFALGICGAKPSWTPQHFIDATVAQVKQQVGSGRAICALSGGVDSSVAAVLVDRAMRDAIGQVAAYLRLRQQRRAAQERVRESSAKSARPSWAARGCGRCHRTLHAETGGRQRSGDEAQDHRQRIHRGVRRRSASHSAQEEGEVEWLVQGTLYPDVIESRSVRGPSQVIKSHHNVGGLPEKMKLKLIEPLKDLFKDEVRRIGRDLGIPEDILQRQPFPGPGLAVRILGEVTQERADLLRECDEIVVGEIKKAGLYQKIWQSFAVLLPVMSVGVMGDQRTYAYTCAVRAVHSEDGMTADWVPLPYEVLKTISNRIVNEVRGVNRVVYDITSKPPGTIEWE